MVVYVNCIGQYIFLLYLKFQNNHVCMHICVCIYIIFLYKNDMEENLGSSTKTGTHLHVLVSRIYFLDL